MGEFFNDTCTEVAETALTSHTTDSGHSWLLFARSSGGSAVPSVYPTNGGVIAAGAADYSMWRSSVIAPSPDVSVLQAIKFNSLSSTTSIGVAARMNSAGNAAYIAIYNTTTKKWGIYRVGAALATTELSVSGESIYTDGASISVELIVTGSGASVSLVLKVDGVNKITTTDTEASRITAAGYVGFWMSCQIGTGAWIGSMSASDMSVSAATAITLTGPTTSAVGLPSSDFTVGANGEITGTVTVMPSATGGGSFSPASVVINAATPTATFKYTAASTGAKSISVTNSGALTSPSPISLTATSTAATAITLTGPSTGHVGEASTPFTASANGTLELPFTVTPSDGAGGGAFSPSTLTLTTGAASGTFTYTPATLGTKSISITNSGALSNPAAISFTSTPVDRKAPFPAAVADKVRGEATAASGLSILLSPSTPIGFQAFSTAFPVGTRAIPVMVQDAAGNWMCADCTLTDASTLTVETINSSSSAGAAPTFAAGVKDVFCVMPAKLAFKARCIDLSDYAIYPDFSGDSTAGIQAAVLDAYERRIEKIICPTGHFKIGGPGVGSGNAQIYVPNTRMANANRSIWFDGVCPPNFENQGLWEVDAPRNGTLFESTIIGSGTKPCVFGGEQGHVDDGDNTKRWNYTNFLMTNCGIRTKTDTVASPKMTALGLRFFAQVPLLDNLMIGVNTPLKTMKDPTGGGSVGIDLPPFMNHAWINLGHVYVSGYETGIRMSEHTHIVHALLLGCVYGIDLLPAAHASRIDMLTCEHVKHAIVMNGNHALSVGLYEAEHNSSFSWGAHVNDVYHVTGTRKIAFLRTDVGDDAFPFNSNNTAAFKVFVGPGAL